MLTPTGGDTDERQDDNAAGDGRGIYADLHTMLDGLTEEQASRIRIGVLGVRDLVIRGPGALRECSCQRSEAAGRVHNARIGLGAGLFLGTEISGRSERWLISAAPVNGPTNGPPGTLRRGSRKHSKHPRVMMESEGLA